MTSLSYNPSATADENAPLHAYGVDIPPATNDASSTIDDALLLHTSHSNDTPPAAADDDAQLHASHSDAIPPVSDNENTSSSHTQGVHALHGRTLVLRQ